MKRASLALLSIAVASAASADPQYREVDVSAAVGTALPIAMNEAGVAALRSTADGQTQSFLFDTGRGVVLRTFDPGQFVNALSANGNVAGTTAGSAFFDGGGSHVTVPLQNARGVNNDGVVAGFVGGFNVQPAIYSTSDGVLTLLAPAGVNGAALAINSGSQVTGNARIGDGGASHAFLWTEGTLVDLGTLGGSSSVGFAIDDGGRVVGAADVSDSTRHAFVYDGSMADLGTLPGCDRSQATAISNSGLIGGDADLCASGPAQGHAFVVSHGAIFDLNQLASAADGATYSTVVGISASGTVIGVAVGADGFSMRAYVLVPVRRR